jgi:hypothetical protein
MLWRPVHHVGAGHTVSHLDPDPVVPARAEEVVHHLEARSTLREVHSRDVYEALELRVDVVTQEPAAACEAAQGGSGGSEESRKTDTTIQECIEKLRPVSRWLSL